jgi:predicted DNA-binding antitoxin AbrB/MazE fold protein
MSKIINAVYENGVLRPTEPVSLSEGEKVRLEVIPETPVEEPQTEWEKALQLASDRGLIKLRPKNNKMDREEFLQRDKAWREKVKNMKPLPGKPLSEEIIEARGPW